MDEQKLEKLAINLSGLMKGTDFSPQNCYDQLKGLFQSQKDFFLRLDKNILFKLIIYVYSYKNTKSFDLARKIMNNLFFAKLFQYNDQLFSEECDECRGNGYETCGHCGGDGDMECSHCDGTGELTCGDCNGSGEFDGEKCDECDGKGEVECYNCQGDGKESCDDCDGSGQVDCDVCGGSGMYETDDLSIRTYDICSWDKDLENRCEIYMGSREPVISDVKFSEPDKKNIIVLDYEDTKLFTEETDEDNFPDSSMLYCLAKDDEVRLLFSGMFKVKYKNTSDQW